MSDDLWTRAAIDDEFRPWICTRCGACVLEGQPRPVLGGLTPREIHARWHARQEGL